MVFLGRLEPLAHPMASWHTQWLAIAYLGHVCDWRIVSAFVVVLIVLVEKALTAAERSWG